MGRRSINTTKSGKYMNPTDQARKEARKQELKKNKKQRQMVRAAVLKGKDPQQILEEMEKIDQMEFNVDQPSPLNEKVLKDKRKKLKDTLDRVLGMYHKDDPDKWTDLKKRQTEYECKKAKLVSFFDSVKSAQSVTVDEIPLPQLPQQAANAMPLPTMENKKPEVPIYSIATALKLQAFGQPIRDPPGCPPGPPPDLNDDGEVIEYAFKHAEMIDEERIVEDTSLDGEIIPSEGPLATKPTSLQQKMVALSGQNVDEFIKEMETVQKKLEQRRDQDQAKLAAQMEQLLPPGTTDPVPTLPSMPPSNPPPIVPPPLIFAGPGIRLPPGPPPGRPLLPPGPPPGLPPLRLPLGPRLIRIPAPPLLPVPQAQLQPVQQIKPNVLTAGPQLINRSESTKQGATISAKPQIRNLNVEVTRFVPSALRVKREERKHKPVTTLVRELKQKEMNLNNQLTANQHTKDDAYKQFMQEMENLM